MARIPNILGANVVCNQKTLEQKIADQGPTNQRVDPHLVGIAIKELADFRQIIRAAQHPSSTVDWYSNVTADPGELQDKLDQLAPLYATVSTGYFPNLIGDALEVCVYKALADRAVSDPRYPFHGSFQLDQPKRDGRYVKSQPPRTISGHATPKEADFIQYDPTAGPLSIECKNLREWVYPHHGLIKELIQKSIQTLSTPVLIARRIHYTTIRNLLEPAGIIAHESLFQYYPQDQADLASRVSHKRALGFTDVRPTEIPHSRTPRFISDNLPKVAADMAERFRSHRSVLLDFVAGNASLRDVYLAIDSPAAATWHRDDVDDHDPDIY